MSCSMGNRTRVIAAFVAAAFAWGATGDAVAAQPVRKVTQRYVAGQDPVAGATAMYVAGVDFAGCEVGPGVVCIPVRRGENWLAFNVGDKTLRQVSGFVSFRRGDGRRTRDSASFCRRGTFTLPPDTALVKISVDATTVRCGLRDGGVATTGRVNAQLAKR